MQRQDKTLDSIQGTLVTLAEQGRLMGQEIGEHNEYIFTKFVKAFSNVCL
jgi:syntaxin 6